MNIPVIIMECGPRVEVCETFHYGLVKLGLHEYSCHIIMESGPRVGDV